MIAFRTPLADRRTAPGIGRSQNCARHLILRLREGFNCSREVRLDHNQYFLARAEHYGPWGIGPAVPVDGAELSPAKLESSAIWEMSALS